MLDLNDDAKITKYNLKKAAERKKRQEEIKRQLREEGIDVDDDAGPAPSYDNHEFFSDTMHELFDEGLEDEEFYKRSLKKLKKFGLDHIVHKYKEYHDANPGATADDLFLELGELIDDPANYV